MGQPIAMAQPQMAQPAQEVMMVQVPQGMMGGMMMQVQTPAGLMQVQIPQGLRKEQAQPASLMKAFHHYAPTCLPPCGLTRDGTRDACVPLAFPGVALPLSLLPLEQKPARPSR